ASPRPLALCFCFNFCFFLSRCASDAAFFFILFLASAPASEREWVALAAACFFLSGPVSAEWISIRMRRSVEQRRERVNGGPIWGSETRGQARNRREWDRELAVILGGNQYFGPHRGSFPELPI